MNPFDLDATGLMVWGLVVHLIADWPLQNDWMANNKALRRDRWWDDNVGSGGFHAPWWSRHPAAFVHAGIHGALLALVFGWVAAPLALAHLVIDCRWVVVKWSQLMRQTQPQLAFLKVADPPPVLAPAVDIGLFVRFWTDQVFHIACIAIAALVVG